MNLGSTIEGTESFKVGRKTNNMYIIRLTTLLGNLSSDTLGTYEELCRDWGWGWGIYPLTVFH